MPDTYMDESGANTYYPSYEGISTSSDDIQSTSLASALAAIGSVISGTILALRIPATKITGVQPTQQVSPSVTSSNMLVFLALGVLIIIAIIAAMKKG